MASIKILNGIKKNSEILEHYIKEKFDNELCFDYLHEYESLLKDICRYWWGHYDPETFYKYYATGKEYESCNKTAYSWYIALMNSNNGFTDFLKRHKLTDHDCYTIGKDIVVQNRKEIAFKLFYEAPFNDFKSFLEWCVTNVSI